MRRLLLMLLCFGALAATVAAQGTVSGRVADAETKAGLPSVNVVLLGTSMGASTNADGDFSIANVPVGTYTVKASLLGYAPAQRSITVTEGTVTISLSLRPSAVEVGEVVVEVNRARERETPVAFSTMGGREIDKRLNSQDAPLLMTGTPGLFAYSTDGVGNGESKVFVRGFDQNRVQVLINGIPTNDPESNAVYWSNWGAVSSAAASIQVQRGAGSSLYGAGSFGGSFNVITQEIGPKFGAELHGSFGTPMLTVIGGSLQTGLLASDKLAGSFTYEWKEGRGTREGAYYQGANYYFAVAGYPDEKSSLKVLVHGGPQEHGYSLNAPIAYFKRFGWEANPANYLPVGVLTQMVGGRSLRDSMRLDDEQRVLKDSKYLTLAHNFYHKPQFEVHYQRDVDEFNSVRGTFFYSVGRGGGSAINSPGALSNATYGADTAGYSLGTSAYQNLNPDNGVIKENAAAAAFVAGRFLGGAYQRISYSLHRQWGVIGSWDWKVREDLKLTIGGEFRDWYADHPGHFTNLFGKSFLSAQKYGYRVNGVVSSAQFTRRTYQGDMADFGGSDKLDVNYVNPFMGYTLSDDGGTYRSQYRNYVGQTTQGTLFLQANYKIDDLTLLGSLQYAAYKYHLTENMPSENAIADSTSAPSTNKEGLAPDAYFYMASYANAAATTPNAWYRFKLVDDTRSRGFLQPKIGANYNLTDEINFFANISHVERLIDLGVWYNFGNPNKDAADEKSNQFEIGAGYKTEELSARLNLYLMTWENKAALIVDVSKAGLPGYDRNGNRWELVGESRNQGIEFEGSYNLAEITGVRGLAVNLSFTAMDNKWTKVLDEVKTEKVRVGSTIVTRRRAFDAGALDANGAPDTLFFDELANTVNASTPFTTLAYGISYTTDMFFATLSGLTAMNYYALDGGTYIGVDGSFDASTPVAKFKVTKYSQTLPDYTVFDLMVGTNLTFDPVKLRVTGQVLNLLDSQFLVSANRSGVLPGVTRSFRLNVAVGI